MVKKLKNTQTLFKEEVLKELAYNSTKNDPEGQNN